MQTYFNFSHRKTEFKIWLENLIYLLAFIPEPKTLLNHQDLCYTDQVSFQKPIWLKCNGDTAA